MKPNLGIEPGPHWWEVSALTTAPSLHSDKFDQREGSWAPIFFRLDTVKKKTYLPESAFHSFSIDVQLYSLWLFCLRKHVKKNVGKGHP